MTYNTPKDDKKFGQRRGPRMSISDEIIMLDQELIQLLARRSSLLSKLRGLKPHASSPGVVQSEKKIRTNWEAGAGKISRDGRFIRELFSLIQDVAVRQMEEGDALAAFNLAPSREPASLVLRGPSRRDLAGIWLALAACLGQDLLISGVQRGKSLLELVKALAQAGVDAEWSKAAKSGEGLMWDGHLELRGQKPLVLTGKSVFVGDDHLAFSLLVFLSLGRTGKIRFTGGHVLKTADFGPLGKLLPQLGARLHFVMPASRGLPASLESSGELPDTIELDEDLPLEAILALFTAALTWGRKLKINFSRVPEKRLQEAMETLSPVFCAIPGAMEKNGGYAFFTGQARTLPKEVETALDPLLSAYLLSLPFFCGGAVSLSGVWPEGQAESKVRELLAGLGLKLDIAAHSVKSSRGGNISMAGGLRCSGLPVELRPLFWAANGRVALQTKGGLFLEKDRSGQETPRGLDMARDFLGRLGLDLVDKDGGLFLGEAEKPGPGGPGAPQGGWPSPGPFWTLAYSLAAFSRPNLKLANPDAATELLPGYWAVYNALPDPMGKAAARKVKDPEPAAAAQSKRRVALNAHIEFPQATDAGSGREE